MTFSHDGMYAAAERDLRNGIEYVYGSAVPGDVVEFGCYLGRSAQILASAMAYCDHALSGSQRAHDIAERRLFLFDSFQGFPEATAAPDKASPHVEHHAWGAGMCAGATPGAVKAACVRYLAPERIGVEPGWFKESLHRIPLGTKFAFVHVDCDLYESTFDVLNHLFKHAMFSDGCAVYFDDWYCNRGSPKFGEQKAWRDARNRNASAASITDWGAYGIVGRRFIVHTES